jgi:hypothetical protein
MPGKEGPASITLAGTFVSQNAQERLWAISLHTFDVGYGFGPLALSLAAPALAAGVRTEAPLASFGRAGDRGAAGAADKKCAFRH